MNLLEVMCKELGVDIDKQWTGNDGYEYKITHNGVLVCIEHNTNPTIDIDCFEKIDDISRVLTGELRPIWRPNVGEAYYIPDPTYQKEMNRCERLVYCGDLYDEWCFNNNLIYKTKEGAIEAANKMIEVIKG